MWNQRILFYISLSLRKCNESLRGIDAKKLHHVRGKLVVKLEFSPPRIRICIISIFSPFIESDMTALNPFDIFRRRQSVAVSWALLAVTAQAQMKEPPCLAVEVEKY